MKKSDVVDLEMIRRARQQIASRVHHTPVLSATGLGARIGCRLHLKAELLQRTGAFKIRGALNRLALLTDQERTHGVCTVSAGNHAQGVALAARIHEIPCVVVMPSGAVRSKVEATRGYGAEVILHGDLTQVFARVRQVEQERGMVFIHPFDHPGIIAGQGTVGLELMEDLPDLDVVVVPIGGGGLASGIGVAVKSISPATRVVGVEPFGADSMWRSLQSGHPEKLDTIQTIADGLSAPFAGELTLAHVRRYLDDVVRVTDEEIVAAMRLLLERCKLLAEPAGAAGTAALLSGRIPGLTGTTRVAAILSGGNIDLDQLSTLLGQKPPAEVC
ncbi:MAG: threonine/serine dehydratase [Acidobacteriota bacterium]